MFNRFMSSQKYHSSNLKVDISDRILVKAQKKKVQIRLFIKFRLDNIIIINIYTWISSSESKIIKF